MATTDYTTSIDQTADATTSDVPYTTDSFDETIEPRTESTTEETTRLALTTSRETTGQSTWVPTTHQPGEFDVFKPIFNKADASKVLTNRFESFSVHKDKIYFITKGI